MTENPIENRRKIKVEVLSYYSLHDIPECIVCGRIDITKLEIDHIEDGGNKHREQLNNHGGYAFYRWLKINGFPEGYQTLCRSCNEDKSFITGTRKGVSGRKGFSVLKYDADGKLIAKYKSLREAARINKINHQNISYAIRSKKNNYVWKLEK